jgi:hypothetical protein
MHRQRPGRDMRRYKESNYHYDYSEEISSYHPSDNSEGYESDPDPSGDTENSLTTVSFSSDDDDDEGHEALLRTEKTKASDLLIDVRAHKKAKLVVLSDSDDDDDEVEDEDEPPSHSESDDGDPESASVVPPLIGEDDGENGPRRWIRKKGLPYKGWRFVECEDLGEPEGQCYMCRKEGIRYQHYVIHDRYKMIKVGCVCAEHLCEDYVNPRRIEGELKSAQRQQRKREERARERWFNLAWWRTSANKKNCYTRKVAGYPFTILKTSLDQWMYLYREKRAYFATHEACLKGAYGAFDKEISSHVK